MSLWRNSFGNMELSGRQLAYSNVHPYFPVNEKKTHTSHCLCSSHSRFEAKVPTGGLGSSWRFTCSRRGGRRVSHHLSVSPHGAKASRPGNPAHFCSCPQTQSEQGLPDESTGKAGSPRCHPRSTQRQRSTPMHKKDYKPLCSDSETEKQVHPGHLVFQVGLSFMVFSG